MTKQIIFFLTFALSTHNCLSMELEKENKVIPLNNGLLTIIPGILSSTGYRGGWLALTDKRIIYDTSKTEDSLINLLYYKQQLTHDKGANDYQLFCPLTIRASNGVIENLGQFNKKQHREALEAIRSGKAIYYAQEQGALIYSLDEQPNAATCKALNNILEKAKQQDIKIPEYLLNK
jgi:hypothetical protein